MIDSQKKIIEQRIALSLVAILVLSIAFTKIRQNALTMLSGGENAINFDIRSASSRLEDITTKGTVRYSGEPLRDPMKIPADALLAEFPRESAAAQTTPAPAQEGEKFICQGIVYNGRKNIAIISGNVVQEGDSVGGARVEKIEKNKVTLLMNGSRIELER